MTGDVVNLRRVRKAKARAADAATADANRARSGRTLTQRKTLESETALAARRHEGHRLVPNPRDDG